MSQLPPVIPSEFLQLVGTKPTVSCRTGRDVWSDQASHYPVNTTFRLAGIRLHLR